MDKIIQRDGYLRSVLNTGTQNAARRLLDGLNSFGETVSGLSTVPSKSVSGWMADQIAPSYWRPNADITNCHLCDTRLDVASQRKIHHCRACGEGFCDVCSDYWRPVPERGWDPEEEVRVRGDFYYFWSMHHTARRLLLSKYLHSMLS